MLSLINTDFIISACSITILFLIIKRNSNINNVFHTIKSLFSIIAYDNRNAMAGLFYISQLTEYFLEFGVYRLTDSFVELFSI